MKKRILAACVAALSLAACDEPRPAPAVVPHPIAITPVEPKPEPRPVAVAVIDAGVVDALSLAHDSPGVDHLARSRTLAEEGDVKGALMEARRALYSTPGDEETLQLLARLARRAKAYQLADEAWGRLAQLDDADATALIQQARCRLALKDYHGVVEAGRGASARDEGNPEAYQVTGLGHLALGALPQAISSFEKVVELEPNHGWALNDLGFAYLRANENVQAVEALERAAALLPQSAMVHNNLGVALERVGATDAAKRALQQAMDLSPKYVKPRVNAARMAKAEKSPVSPPDSPESLSDVPADAHPFPQP